MILKTELSDELDSEDCATIMTQLKNVFETLPMAEVRASLAIEYTRKNYKERYDVWPDESTYRDRFDDWYVLTVEVKVPCYSTDHQFYNFVEDNAEALKEKSARELEAKREKLLSEVAELDKRIEDLG